MALLKKITKETDYYFKFAGLRPSTRHYFYFDVVNKSNRCKQLGKKLGDPLITDENGVLELSFYLSSDIMTDSAGSAIYRTAALSTGVKQIVLTNIDQTELPLGYQTSSISSARVTIKV